MNLFSKSVKMEVRTHTMHSKIRLSLKGDGSQQGICITAYKEDGESVLRITFDSTTTQRRTLMQLLSSRHLQWELDQLGFFQQVNS